MACDRCQDGKTINISLARIYAIKILPFMNPESVLFSGFIFYSPPINKICLVIAYLQLCKKIGTYIQFYPKFHFNP